MKIQSQKLKEMKTKSKQSSVTSFKQDSIKPQLPPEEESSLKDEPGPAQKMEMYTNKKGDADIKATTGSTSSNTSMLTPSDAEFPMPLYEEAFLAFNSDPIDNS